MSNLNNLKSELNNELLNKYNEILVEHNKITNLTAHKTIEQSRKYNIDDSILFGDVIGGYFAKVSESNAGRAPMHLDIGSGGGSPAIPIKISFPQINTTMLDSVRKKTDFLNSTVSELGLPDITAIHTRIEDFCASHRESFDVVTARAVAGLNTLVEYALPLLRVGGHLIAYKGQNANEEIQTASRAIGILGGRVTEVATANLDSDTVRTLVIIEKHRPTPSQYPRGKNLPRIKPIM